MKVVIDGIEYVPAVEIGDPPEGAVGECLRSLTEIIYFHECTHKDRAWAFDALRALSPGLANLAEQDPQRAFDAVRDDDDE